MVYLVKMESKSEVIIFYLRIIVKDFYKKLIFPTELVILSKSLLFYEVIGSENGFLYGMISKNQFLGHFSPSFLVKIGNFIFRFHLDQVYDDQITQVLFIIHLTCSLCVALVWCLSSASGCGCALNCCTGL